MIAAGTYQNRRITLPAGTPAAYNGTRVRVYPFLRWVSSFAGRLLAFAFLLSLLLAFLWLAGQRAGVPRRDAGGHPRRPALDAARRDRGRRVDRGTARRPHGARAPPVPRTLRARGGVPGSRRRAARIARLPAGVAPPLISCYTRRNAALPTRPARVRPFRRGNARRTARHRAPLRRPPVPRDGCLVAGALGSAGGRARGAGGRRGRAPRLPVGRTHRRFRRRKRGATRGRSGRRRSSPSGAGRCSTPRRRSRACSTPRNRSSASSRGWGGRSRYRVPACRGSRCRRRRGREPRPRGTPCSG